jgi:hypothetical protein
MSKIISLYNEDKLTEEIDRIPLQMSPKNAQARGRCCIHKERAVLKYKMLPILGYSVDEEEDERDNNAADPLFVKFTHAVSYRKQQHSCHHHKQGYATAYGTSQCAPLQKSRTVCVKTCHKRVTAMGEYN